MTEKRTVFGIDPQDIRQFLDDCLAPTRDSADEAVPIEQLLQEQLAEKCPVSRPVQSGSGLIDEVQDKVCLRLSRPIQAVLSDDRTSLDTLRDIKDRYKKWAEKASNKKMQRVYATIYFAAIARALIAHNKRITRHSPAYLAQSFQVLADEPWMAPTLKELYRQAQQACQ
ncbi:MAG: hypothetical protein JW955_06130 [Sedimentisphaerales bacterium]|nr:hypothetical protein [Sedimentisphaerales bacterium]